MTGLAIERLALLSSAEGGIARLRKLIRDLAVNGRLIEPPLNSPAWTWSTLGIEVSGMDSGWSPICLDRPSPSTDVWAVLRTTAVQSLRYVPDENKELPATLEPRPEAEVKVGDVLFTRAGPMNRVGISCLVDATRPRLMLSDKIIRFRPRPDRLDGRFTALCLNAGATANYLEAAKSGMAASQVNISQAKLKAAPIPVPPLSEQHRIVAKVDELMALCDRLEARQQDAEAAHARLVQALLDSLTQARNADDFQACWQRVAGQFGAMFGTETSVDALKEAVLQAGCSGRIQAGESAVREPSAKYLAPHGSRVDNPFDLPAHWRWCRLGDICALVTSGSRGWKAYYADAGSTFIRSQDIKYDRLEFDQRAYVALPANAEGARTQVARGDLLITITGANVGKAALIHEHLEDAYVSQHVALVRLTDPAQAPFVHQWLTNGLGGRRLLLASSYGAKPGLNLQNIKDLPVPLPPLDEQRHIVAKVTELLALCDQLKAHIAAARAKHAQLVQALVEAAVA